MALVVVTGGAGFIGSNTVRILLAKGYKVRVIDNMLTGRIENLQDILPGIEFLGGDILNFDYLLDAFKGADYVLHMAALPSVPRSVASPEVTHRVNVDGTFNVLRAARDVGVKKVVFSSSSSVYGNRKGHSKKETMKPQPLSPYAVTKNIGEEYMKVFSHIYGLPTVCLRYFNVFGHRQDPNSAYAAVVPRFVTKILKGEEIVVYGDGKNTRDFTYIDNVVNANILAMTSKKVVLGESINIACGDSMSIISLAKGIEKIVGKKAKIKFEDFRPGEVRNSLADISKAKRLLGYKPKVKFMDGLRRTVEWYQENTIKS